MIKCCKDCQERAINCHSTCEKYLLEAEQNRIQREQKRKFNEGNVSVIEYNRSRYRAFDRRNHVRELRGRKKW